MPVTEGRTPAQPAETALFVQKTDTRQRSRPAGDIDMRGPMTGTEEEMNQHDRSEKTA